MLVIISKNIWFVTVEALPNCTILMLVKGIKSIATIYGWARFCIMTAKMDGEFEAMHGDLAVLEINLNEAVRDEHVGEVKQFIYTLKEWMCAIYNSLPFTNMPPWIMIEMAKHAVYWLNAFPHQDSISNTLSLWTIITRQTVDFNCHCHYEFGKYIQMHEQHDNTMVPQTIDALMMCLTGNAQGNYYFFSLSTGHIINHAHAMKLPMPDDMISQVHVLAWCQKVANGLIFLDHNQILGVKKHQLNCKDFDDDDSDFDPNDDDLNSDGNDDEYNDPPDDHDVDGEANHAAADDDHDCDYYPNDEETVNDDYSWDYDSDDTGDFPGVNADAHPEATGGTPGVNAEEIKAEDAVCDARDVVPDDDEPPARSAGVG